MLLGKRKNNCISSILEPLPKRAKYSLDSYFSELEKTFKKIKLVHDKDCKLNFQIVNDKIIPVLTVNEQTINPYFLDFY